MDLKCITGNCNVASLSTVTTIQSYQVGHRDSCAIRTNQQVTQHYVQQFDRTTKGVLTMKQTTINDALKDQLSRFKSY